MGKRRSKRPQHNNELAKTNERDQYGIDARFVTGGYAGTENTRRQMHQIFLVPAANTAGRSLGVGPPSDVGDQSGESRWGIFLYGRVREDVAELMGVVKGRWAHRHGHKRRSNGGMPLRPSWLRADREPGPTYGHFGPVYGSVLPSSGIQSAARFHAQRSSTACQPHA